MKVLIFGRNKADIESLVKGAGFEIVDPVRNNPAKWDVVPPLAGRISNGVEGEPEFIISYGGDGTLMKAEHYYPGVPKILLKNSLVCKQCPPFSNEEVLKRVIEGKYKIEEFYKLKVKTESKIFYSMNDVIVHNKDPRHAIRYRLFIDNEEARREVIGDGIVIATPFGSTGYYRSITDSSFETGIGLAFNNSTEQSDHMVLRDDRKIKIKIMRGPAVVYADNQEEIIELNDGDEVLVEKSEKTAKIVTV